MIKIPLKNGCCITAETVKWCDDEPEELCVCIEKDGVILQDIVCVRKSSSQEENDEFVELLAWTDHESEDYTHKYKIRVVEEED